MNFSSVLIIKLVLDTVQPFWRLLDTNKPTDQPTNKQTDCRLPNYNVLTISIATNLSNVHVYSFGLLVLREKNINGCLVESRQPDIKPLSSTLISRYRFRGSLHDKPTNQSITHNQQINELINQSKNKSINK